MGHSEPRKPYRLLCLLACASLAGCVVGPNYQRPEVATPSAYKEAQGVDWARADEAAPPPPGTWWADFGDPELDALVERVADANLSVAQAEASYRQAEALAATARAALWPAVGADGAYNRQGSSSGNSRTVTTASATLTASWEIDLWGRLRRQVEAASADAQASASDLAGARLSAQAALVQDYIGLRVADAQRQLLDAQAADYARSLDLTRARFAAGVVSGADVAQAETQLKTTQARAIDTAIGRAQLEHAIAVLIGVPPADFSLAPAALTLRQPGRPTGLPSELLLRRPDIAAAERRVASANARIGVAEAAWYPSLSLGASGGLAATSLSELLRAPTRIWSLGPSLALTLFDGGARQAAREEAVAAYDGTVAAYRQTVLGGFQEVEDNLAALRWLDDETRVQDEAVAAARRSADLTVAQYRAGTVSYLGVVVAQAVALSAESDRLTMEGRRLTAGVALVKALGGGWQADGAPAASDKAQ